MKAARIAALAAIAAATACAPAEASTPHTVQPGETLSGIAAANGLSTSALAAANGISATSFVISGSTIQIPSATSATTAPSAPAATTTQPSGSLTSAIGWQESGFNNSVVSSAGAQGVMQVMPGTWDYVERNYGVSLDPSSPQDNIRAGSLYLQELIREFGDERMAVAAYYQGPASVRQYGVFPETQHYVDNVMALRSRFGG
jgi:N-acetylmuramoyl-L-alanine amidase